MPIETPIAFVIFNRPDVTQRVFETISQAKPRKLLVVADGPRAERSDEWEKCVAARGVIDRVDWDCEVLTDFSDTNMGCKLRVSSGLNWVFSQVEEAIILEDDCLPHPSFFTFCELMLNKYREDERVMAICGTNVFGNWKLDQQSYHFSYHGGVWGWASWRRAWDAYDVNISAWNNEEVKARFLDNIPTHQHEHWRWVLDEVAANRIDTWDFQWFFARCVQSGLTIVPSANTITNIGFGEGATHTLSTGSPFSLLPLSPARIPISHPLCVVADREYDNRFFAIENEPTKERIDFRKRVVRKARHIMSRL